MLRLSRSKVIGEIEFVVDLPIAIFHVADQRIPVGQGVGDGLPEGTLRQHLGRNRPE